MSELEAYCACLRVDYDPEEVSGGKMRERWVCRECQTEFVKYRFDKKKLTTLKAEIARVKESWDKTAWENTSLIQKKGELEEELVVNDKLLNARNEVLDEIPECPDHGKQCMPHCSEWIRKEKGDLR